MVLLEDNLTAEEENYCALFYRYIRFVISRSCEQPAYVRAKLGQNIS